jgi:membrane protein
VARGAPRRRWWRRLVVALRQAVTAYNADNCSSFANAIAYNALLALVPLLVFLLAVAGLVLRDAATQERVQNALLANLPITTPAGRAQLQAAMTTLTETRPVLGIVSLLLAAYAARGIMLHLRTGLTIALGIERHRSLVRGVLVDLTLAAGLGLLLLLSLILTLGLTLAQTAHPHLLGAPLPRVGTLLLTLVYAVAPILVSLLVFAVMYRVAARGVLTWRAVLPGALLAAGCFEAIKLAFAQYAARGDALGTAAGALGGVLAVLALPHFGAQIALFGAVFARVYRALGDGSSQSGVRPSHTLLVEQDHDPERA